ncbi:MAG: lipase, partial [Pirellula sp.]
MDTMNVFGDQNSLVGWYSDPAAKLKSDVAVVMLTPGMLSHVGPMRLHVQLARGLERMGMASFRFDLSGIGE